MAPVFARAAVSPREKLFEFNYRDVTLIGGPLKRQYDHLHRHFLSLDNDRLLKVYRQRAGLPAPGDEMGGWYDADGFVPGSTIGQYISGLSRFANCTGDQKTVSKVRALVDGYAATVGPNGYPYASDKGAITWPCYILDKYEIGMLDAYRLAGIQSARDVLPKVIRGAIGHIPDHTYDRTPDSPKQAPYDEPYILSENLFNSWEATGEQQFFDMAKMYLLNHEYYEPLAAGKNILPGKHAYSHVISLSSAAKAYQVLGDPKYLDAIRNAWDMIEQTQQFASGGWGPQEAFVSPDEGKLGDALTATRSHFETPCGAYAHLKLARYLLRFTADARYGDGLERVLYNTILGSLDPGDDGLYFYYSDYQSGAKKGFYHRKWPCCSGTLAQGVADYPVNIYFHSADTLWVNLFAPSEVRWHSVKLTQTGSYPEGEDILLQLELPAPREFTLRIRVPRWLESTPEFRVNGKKFETAAERGSFAALRRRWRNGDRVDVHFPQRERFEAVDDRHPNTVALMKGPLMYVSTDISAGRAERARLGASRSGVRPFYAVTTESYDTYFIR